MFANIPPGIPFLVKTLPQLLFPPAVAFLLLHFSRAAGYELSTWMATMLYIFSFPVVFTISITYGAIDNRLAAARMGAVMIPEPPFMEDPSPGRILTVYRALKGSKQARYPGMYFYSLYEFCKLTI